MAQQNNDRGARSLVWIRQQISRYFFTRTPVTSVLEVTVILNRSDEDLNQLQQIQNIDFDINRNFVRKKIYGIISDNLKNNRQILINNQNVSIMFTEAGRFYVHHITQDTWNDQVKAIYVKRLQLALIHELNLRFRAWNVGLNFLLTRPLDYAPLDQELMEDDEDDIMLEEEEDVV